MTEPKPRTGSTPMDLTQMYMTSPDWLKLLWTVLPHVSIWVVAYLILKSGDNRARRPRDLELRRDEGERRGEVFRIEE